MIFLLGPFAIDVLDGLQRISREVDGTTFRLINFEHCAGTGGAALEPDAHGGQRDQGVCSRNVLKPDIDGNIASLRVFGVDYADDRGGSDAVLEMETVGRRSGVRFDCRISRPVRKIIALPEINVYSKAGALGDNCPGSIGLCGSGHLVIRGPGYNDGLSALLNGCDYVVIIAIGAAGLGHAQLVVTVDESIQVFWGNSDGNFIGGHCGCKRFGIWNC